MISESENWIEEAPCARPVETDESAEPRLLDFHSNNQAEQARAKALCAECPFRKKCLQYAYDGKERFGIWGGVDEEELRRNQAINAKGEPHVSKLGKIRCAFCGPYSGTENLEVLESKRTRSHIRCNAPDCGIDWWARKSINKKRTNF